MVSREDQKCIDDIMHDNFDSVLLQRFIAQGSFSYVFEAQTLSANREMKRIAAKVAKNDPTSRQHLERERRIYQMLHFPEPRSCFAQMTLFSTPRLFATLDLCGDTLEMARLKQPGMQFDTQYCLVIAAHVFNLLEQIHKAGIVHRDVKPENFAFSLGTKELRILPLDFGLARTFLYGTPAVESVPEQNVKKSRNFNFAKFLVRRSAKTSLPGLSVSSGSNESTNASTLSYFHVKRRSGLPFCGTMKYASIAAHLGEEQSRKDDLESAIYTMIHLHTGTLPWEGMVDGEDVCNLKMTIKSEELCAQMAFPFTVLHKYIRSMQFDSIPSTSHIVTIIHNAYRSRKYKTETSLLSIETLLRQAR